MKPNAASQAGTSSLDPQIALLLRVIDQAFDHRSWHGPNLRAALRGVTAQQAAWRSQPGRHNIWELAVHAAYWKYIAYRRLVNLSTGSFGIAGSNWFPRPEAEPSAAAWRRDLSLLAGHHRTLRQAVAALRPEDLAVRPPGGGRDTAQDLILGVAAHDVYHAGQILLLRRLQGC